MKHTWMESHGIRLKEEGVTKRKKRAWWKQKSERIAEHRFGTFRISFAAPHSSFVLEPDYVDIVKRLRLMSQPLFCCQSTLMLTGNKIR